MVTGNPASSSLILISSCPEYAASMRQIDWSSQPAKGKDKEGGEFRQLGETAANDRIDRE
ncbi:MAG: hypothetical protein BroJett021_00790 [Chloroflexota bacterium]|nr:MAG: hypothetical protein BroJett021_00790 [Chloroflexota bacterium]